METEKKYQSFLCPLKELADKEIHVEGGKITMDIPAFQRGLVWNPAQVEALWDSVLRGIPIGTITLIQYTGARGDNEATHGVFDGQQRLNALSLGYKNPFATDKDGANESILWLDLLPKQGTIKTRKFYLYLTTPGQPWGYKISDAVGDNSQSRLSADEYRSAMGEAFGDALREQTAKPQAREMWPYQAQCPVPFGIIWEAAQEPGDFKEHLLAAVKKYGAGRAWYEKKVAAQLGKLAEADMGVLENGLENAKAAKAVVVVSPQTFDRTLGAVDDTQAETDVAVFFSRLNRGGSVPGPEDVNYSILKSIVPALGSIDTIAENRMKPSRMATIAMRLYLTERRDQRWRTNITRKDVYGLASDGEFREYVKVDGPLQQRVRKLEEMLLWARTSGSRGIPAYVLSYVVRNNPELYMLFLSMVEQAEQNDSTYLAAFVLLAIYGSNITYAHAYEHSRKSIRQLLYHLAVNGQLYLPPPPAIYHGILEAARDRNKDALDQAWNPDLYKGAVDRVWGWSNFESRILLLYACRDYIGRTFPKYDPANAAWKDDNCPWDYDHIFPQNWLIHGQGNRQGGYHGIVNDFINCIGNIAPIPFTRNRQRHDNAPYDAEHHYLENEDAGLFTDLDNSDPKPAFLCEYPQNRIENDQAATFDLGCIIARRLERIYRECYESLKWGELLDFTECDRERRDLFGRFAAAMRAQGVQVDKCSVWAIAHRGLQKQIQQPGDWGRDWLACGIPMDFEDASGNQRKGLACICSNGKMVEWGMRRHPDETGVDGDTYAWWLPNADNSADWPEGKICKTCKIQEVDDKMQEIAGAVVSLINARRVH